MNVYEDFVEFHLACTSIVEDNLVYCENISTLEKIKFIREHCDKAKLNSYYVVGSITQEEANAILSRTTLLKFSADNLIKNMLEHPEITINEYLKLGFFMKNAEYILKKNNKNLIYFKINDEIYQIVIKSTKIGNEIFITTFHKASSKQLSKDILRYISIKKDSSDYEDSKYPSVT